MLTQKRESNTAIALPGDWDYRQGDWGHRSVGFDRPWRQRRFFWMVVLGCLVGGAAGCLALFLRAPQFRSTALVQIVELGTNSRPLASDTMIDFGTPLSDEVLVIRSERMLRKAAEIGGLEKTTMFSGWNHEDIAAGLNSSSSLVVTPGFADKATNVIKIQFDAPDPTTPRCVVESIVTAYSLHTEEKFEEGDDQEMQQILAARDEAESRLRELERQHDEFKQQTDLLLVDGRPKSIHRKTADRYQEELEELRVTKTELESQLNAAEDSLKRGESPTTVLLALRGETETASDVIDQGIANQLQRIRDESQARASLRVRETKLLPLEVERNELLQNFGPRHPKVLSIDQRIAVIEAEIQSMEAEEREKEAMIAKAMSLRPNAGVDLDPDAELRQRVDVALDGLRQQLDSVQQQIRVVDEAYQEEREAANQELVAERDSLRFEREIARQAEFYERILARLDDVQLTTGTQRLSVFPLEDARPGVLVTESIVPWGVAGALIGMVSASLLGLLLPSPDRSYQSSDQVAKHLSMPVLGHVPLLRTLEAAVRVGSSEHPGLHPKLCTVHAPYGRTAEGFNAIRTALLFSEAARGNQIIQVTSAAPGAGKSTVSANLAVSIARSGKSVLLLDADLRRPNIQQLFGLRGDRGLGWLLETMTESDCREDVAEVLGEVIQDGPVGNLSIISAGKCLENPSELFASDRISVLLEVLRDKFDLVIIDSPPMLAVTDPSSLAPRVDAVLLVVRSELNDRVQAARATDMLATLNANVIGVIVNGIDENGGAGYRIYPTTGKLSSRSSSLRDGAGYSYGSGDFSEYYSQSSDSEESDVTTAE